MRVRRQNAHVNEGSNAIAIEKIMTMLLTRITIIIAKHAYCIIQKQLLKAIYQNESEN